MRRLDIIDEYAKKDGPLPKRNRAIGYAFWTGYVYPNRVDMGTSIADRAMRAGRKRCKVEPDLTVPAP